MLRELQRYLRMNRLIDVIYLDRRQRFSQRRLRLLSLDGDRVKAYCYARRSLRVFSVSNILAVRPVNEQTTEMECERHGRSEARKSFVGSEPDVSAGA